MKFYIEVISPMDQTIVGPFDSYREALAYCESIPHDCTILNEIELAESFAKYGKLPIQSD